jgi:hypothetical protein
MADDQEIGYVRQPQAWLTIGGNEFNLLSCRVVQEGQGQASSSSTFEAEVALDDPSSVAAGGAQFWSTVSGSATITGSNGDGSGTQTLIQNAAITNVEADMGRRMVRVEGEGDSFSQGRNDQNYTNQPISSVLNQIASKYGLGVVVTAKNASQMAGKTYDKQNYSFLTDVMSDKDTIQALAHQAGASVFVHGQNLYFLDPGTAPGGTYAITYVPPVVGQSYDMSNAMHILCTHNHHAAAADNTTNVTQNTGDKAAYTANQGLDAVESPQGDFENPSGPSSTTPTAMPSQEVIKT